MPNGGEVHPSTIPRGMDGVDLPATEPTAWQLGTAVEVAFAMMANHGGGYSYRLCPKSENITEECFQQNVLRFHGNSSWIQYTDRLRKPSAIIYDQDPSEFMKLPRFEVPRVIVPGDQVHPKGSQWARNPIPSCFYCDQSKCGTLLPNLTEEVQKRPGNYGGDAWFKQEICAQECSGYNLMQCLPGMTQFPEPLPGLSGYLGNFMISDVHTHPDEDVRWGIEGFNYNIVDEVDIPADLECGDYVLSWRWDCEQSNQIWQNCADVRLVQPEAMHV